MWALDYSVFHLLCTQYLDHIMYTFLLLSMSIISSRQRLHFKDDLKFAVPCVFCLLIRCFWDVWYLTVFICFIIFISYSLNLNKKKAVNFVPLSHISLVSGLSKTILYSSSLYWMLVMRPSGNFIIPLQLK